MKLLFDIVVIIHGRYYLLVVSALEYKFEKGRLKKIKVMLIPYYSGFMMSTSVWKRTVVRLLSNIIYMQMLYQTLLNDQQEIILAQPHIYHSKQPWPDLPAVHEIKI